MKINWQIVRNRLIDAVKHTWQLSIQLWATLKKVFWRLTAWCIVVTKKIMAQPASRATALVLVILGIGVGSFYGGIAHEKRQLASAVATRLIRRDSSKTTAARPPISQTQTYRGTITALDDTTITLKTSAGVQKIIVTDKTKFSKAGKAATLKDLNKNDQVNVSGVVNNDSLVATTIRSVTATIKK